MVEPRHCVNKWPPHVPYASSSHIMTIYCIIVMKVFLVMLFFFYSSTVTLVVLWSTIILFELN